MKNLTTYQQWINPALKKSGISLKELAQRVDMDYSALWKIARGNPETYPGSSRPEYDNALKIAEALGDVPGGMKAAGYLAAEKSNPNLEALALRLSRLSEQDQARVLDMIERLSEPQ